MGRLKVDFWWQEVKRIGRVVGMELETMEIHGNLAMSSERLWCISVAAANPIGTSFDAILARSVTTAGPRTEFLLLEFYLVFSVQSMLFREDEFIRHPGKFRNFDLQ